MEIKTIQKQYYGDNLRWFMGVVVDNQDPLRVGRLRVRIYGIHNDDVNEVPQSSLPWAQVMLPSTEAGVSGVGRATGIQPGAQVFGFFMDGTQSQLPIILGSMLRFEPNDLPPSVNTFDVADDPSVRTNPDAPNPPNTPTPFTAVGESNSEIAFNFLLGQGYTPVQAAGIIGNFLKESNMDPSVTSSFPGEESFGIAQWNPAAGRLQQLQEFATDRGLDYTTLETQLQFFHYDFSTLSPRYWGYNEFRGITDIDRAADHICDKYERPNPNYADKPGRRAYALQVYEAFN